LHVTGERVNVVYQDVYTCHVWCKSVCKSENANNDKERRTIKQSKTDENGCMMHVNVSILCYVDVRILYVKYNCTRTCDCL